jgi:hypothetical protein
VLFYPITSFCSALPETRGQTVGQVFTLFLELKEKLGHIFGIFDNFLGHKYSWASGIFSMPVSGDCSVKIGHLATLCAKFGKKENSGSV